MKLQDVYGKCRPLPAELERDGTMLCPQPKIVDERRALKIQRIVVHRVGGPEWPRTVPELVRSLTIPWYGATKEYACPYAYLVDPYGLIWRMHDSVTRVGQHAGAWNRPGQSIGLVGDFRVEHPTEVQLQSAALLAERECLWLRVPIANISRHTDLRNATAHSGKRCPGPLLDINDLRRRVAVVRAGL